MRIRFPQRISTSTSISISTSTHTRHFLSTFPKDNNPPKPIPAGKPSITVKQAKQQPLIRLVQVGTKELKGKDREVFEGVRFTDGWEEVDLDVIEKASGTVAVVGEMSDQGFKTVFTEGAAFPAGPYSQAIATPTTIYCSGQIPCTAAGRILTTADSSISDMTELCIKNLTAVLEAAGSSLAKVVKVNVFLTTMDSFAEMNGVYEKFFTHKPARSCVAVYQLPKGVPVEIECVALA